MRVRVESDVLKKNKEIALLNRSFLKEKGVLTINLMASPGAGKTSLILNTLTTLDVPFAVIEGDIASSIDTDTLKSHGIPAVQINTGGSCHLNASMVKRALEQVTFGRCKILFIENVGNLVCPAPFDLGEDLKIVLSSIPEGDDKPYKYPQIFTVAQAIIINKIDLIPFVDFNMEKYERGVRAINMKVPIFKVSCKTGEGIEEWMVWLRKYLS